MKNVSFRFISVFLFLSVFFTLQVFCQNASSTGSPAGGGVTLSAASAGGTAASQAGVSGTVSETPEFTGTEDEYLFNETPSQKNSSLSGFTSSDEEKNFKFEETGNSMAWDAVKMLFFLAIFIAVIIILFKFIKKQNSPGNEENPFLRKVSQVTLQPGKTVQVVTLLDSAFVLGVSDSNVNLIEKIEDKELVNALNVYADKNSPEKKPKTFSELLEIFMPNKNAREAKKKREEENREIIDGLKDRWKNMEEGK